MSYAWYPGCSLRGTGRAYEASLLAVFQALGVEVNELKDWNCCGSTAYLSVDELTSYALVARNLSLAAREHKDIVAPCAACYMILNKTQHYVADYPEVRLAVTRAMEAIDLAYDDRVKVRHPLDVLLNDVGVKAIKEKTTHPLKGLKVAPYYGCQIVRPYATFDDQLNPVSMDKLLEACGATVVRYPLKTHCCGGSQKGVLPDVGLDLIRNLLAEAKRQGADVMATVCPLCQFNVEAFQQDAANPHLSTSMPILYFSQLMGLALGASARDVGLQRSFVPVEPLLAGKGIAYA